MSNTVSLPHDPVANPSSGGVVPPVASPRLPVDPAKHDGAAGQAVPEIGGRDGPDPTRYGDWEKDGKCTDF